MSTPVNGPGDVKVGDVVIIRFGKFARSFGVVSKVGADKLTVKRRDGGVTSLAYVKVEKESTWRGHVSTTYVNFERLNAHERWTRTGPTCDAVASAWLKEPTISILSSAIRDRPDEVCAQIVLLSAWLKAEPSKGEP